MLAFLSNNLTSSSQHFSISLFFYIFLSFLRLRTWVLWYCHLTKPLAIGILWCYYCFCNLSKMFLFNLSSIEGFLELGIILYDFLLISFGIFGSFIFKLSIIFSRVFLYLLGIAIILVFAFVSLIAYLRTCFLKITIIQFWHWEDVKIASFFKLNVSLYI